MSAKGKNGSKTDSPRGETLWDICLTPSGFGLALGEHFTVSATSLEHDGHWLVLRNRDGHVVFSTANARYVRRIDGSTGIAPAPPGQFNQSQPEERDADDPGPIEVSAP